MMFEHGIEGQSLEATWVLGGLALPENGKRGGASLQPWSGGVS